jgi:FkbM family methyltransferase
MFTLNLNSTRFSFGANLSNFYDFHKQISLIPKSKLVSVSEFLVSMFYTQVYASGVIGDSIDAGANSGLHTRQLALHTLACNSRVIAIEPNKRMRKVITQNCQSEMCFNFEVENSPLWESNRRLQFKVLDDSQLSFAKPSSFLGKRGITLDQCVQKYSLNLKFLKIDVEGSGTRVLMGSLELLSELKPFIAIECGPWDSEIDFRSVYLRMTEIGYVGVDCGGNLYDEDSWNWAIPNLFWNRFFVPEESIAILPSLRNGMQSIWSPFISS